MNVLALTASPPSELTDEQFDRLHKSILYQLDRDERFRSDVAADIARDMTLRGYEDWLEAFGGEV